MNDMKEQRSGRPTHRVTTFVERDVAERVERLAQANERSVSAQVRFILRRALNEGK
jgi:CopG-like RHH_1 or ribbon-helix-helix domain, RHH_5